MNFDWSPRSLKEWQDFYKQTQSANWMQTWAYAQASFKVDFLHSKMALITQNDRPLGMMCVQDVKLGPFRIINLKRGPLWFSNPDPELLIEFATRFRQEFPKRLFQRLRWMPEFDFIPLQEQGLAKDIEKIGFRMRTENFVTAWIDLTASESDIRKNLDQKWRNCLNKAVKLNTQTTAENRLDQLNSFFHLYQDHFKSKGYKATTVSFLKEEFLELEKTGDVVLLWSHKDKLPVSGIAITFQGTTACYRIGWNTFEGRKLNSHYLLLWNALHIAKARGCTRFDIGGLLPEDAPGLTHFKLGLGGQITKTYIFS